MASSYPKYRSAKNIWPDISPASAAPSAFILALIKEWPVFHMIGRPPRAAMSS